MIFDEINYVISYHMLPVEKVVAAFAQRPARVHVICTGRNAHPQLVEAAALVSDSEPDPGDLAAVRDLGPAAPVFHAAPDGSLRATLLP